MNVEINYKYKKLKELFTESEKYVKSVNEGEMQNAGAKWPREWIQLRFYFK